MTEFEFRSAGESEERYGAVGELRTGLMRATLLFGALALALALIAVPILQEKTRQFANRQAPQLDMMATGSISPSSGGVHRVQRSIVQPGGACIVQPGGMRQGAC